MGTKAPPTVAEMLLALHMIQEPDESLNRRWRTADIDLQVQFDLQLTLHA